MQTSLQLFAKAVLLLAICSNTAAQQAGTLDAGFDANGIGADAVAPIPSFGTEGATAIQADGEIILVGQTLNTSVIIPSLVNGQPDPSFVSAITILNFKK